MVLSDNSIAAIFDNSQARAWVGGEGTGKSRQHFMPFGATGFYHCVQLRVEPLLAGCNHLARGRPAWRVPWRVGWGHQGGGGRACRAYVRMCDLFTHPHQCAGMLRP